MRKLSEIEKAVEAAAEATGGFVSLSIEIWASRNGKSCRYQVWNGTYQSLDEYATISEAVEALERIAHPVHDEDILLDAEDVRAEMTFDEPNGGDDD